MIVEMDEDDGRQREQTEQEMWEEHKKQLALLDELLSEEHRISDRINHIFGGLHERKNK